MEWSDQKKAELIDLYVYAGKDGSYTLYEDEGTNYNYEKGKYAMIDFKYNDAQKTITIAARKFFRRYATEASLQYRTC